MHCWKDHAEHIEELFGFHSDEHIATYADGWQSGTCMLEDGHDGPHEFTPDTDIGVKFSGEQPS